MLSIQGTLVDIVERVSPQGIEDQRLTIVDSYGAFTLQHQALSPLLDHCCEAQKVTSGQGFLMRWLGAVQTDTSMRTRSGTYEKVTSAAYPQYEYSVLALMALSGIEQLLRAF